MSNLYFGISIAPYRVDFCNWLSEHFQCKIYHQEVRAADLAYSLERQEEECRFRRYHYPAHHGLFRQFRFFRQLIQEENPSYVFVNEFSRNALIVLAIRAFLRKEFKVVSICDDSFDMIQGNDFSLLHRLARRIVTPLLDNLIVDNRKTEVWYREKYGKGVYFPIIADENRWRERMKAALPLVRPMMEELGIQDDKPVILFVGRLIPLKNIPSLIRAYDALKDRARLVIVGSGESESLLKEMDKSLGADIIFTGLQEGSRLIAWYGAADILVLPSFREAFGAVVNEALMSGLYTLVSNRAGSSTLIAPGVNGDCFDPSSVEDLRVKLQSAVSRVLPVRRGVLKDNAMPCQFVQMIESAMHQIVSE